MKSRTFFSELRQDISQNKLLEAITKIQRLLYNCLNIKDVPELREFDKQIIQLSRMYHAQKKLSIAGIENIDSIIISENQITNRLLFLIDALKNSKNIHYLSKSKEIGINGEQDKGNVNNRIHLIIKLDRKYDKYNKEEAIETLKELDNMISIGSPIKLRGIEEGCVILKVELSKEQADNLKELYENSQLDPLKVIGIFPDDIIKNKTEYLRLQELEANLGMLEKRENSNNSKIVIRRINSVSEMDIVYSLSDDSLVEKHLSEEQKNQRIITNSEFDRKLGTNIFVAILNEEIRGTISLSFHERIAEINDFTYFSDLLARNSDKGKPAYSFWRLATKGSRIERYNIALRLLMHVYEAILRSGKYQTYYSFIPSQLNVYKNFFPDGQILGQVRKKTSIVDTQLILIKLNTSISGFKHLENIHQSLLKRFKSNKTRS